MAGFPFLYFRSRILNISRCNIYCLFDPNSARVVGITLRGGGGGGVVVVVMDDMAAFDIEVAADEIVDSQLEDELFL